MTREDIIRMAREAQLAKPYHPYNPWSASQEALERFAALVAAEEREACARLVRGIWASGRNIVVKAIRERGGE